ncbi:D-3-phosphoglycerate dehydrogenase [Usnea florida]
MGGGPDAKPEHMLVILPFQEPTEIFDRIRKNHPNIKITYKNTLLPDAVWFGGSGIPKEIFRDATILVTISALPPTPADCPNLQLIHFFSAGTNHVADSPIYTDTSIPLTTSSGIHGPQIAEWVVLTMLAHSHRYSLLHTWQQNHEWGTTALKEPLRSLRDKAGQRLGVLGYGSIGRQVAHVARGMGMTVIAYTASPRPTPASKHDTGFIVPGTGDPDGSIPEAWFSGLDKASLQHFLAQDIDHLLVSVPLTRETTHFIGAAELAILGQKKNAFLSNISRGQIIVQRDLVASLNAYNDNDPLHGGDGGGGLRGAALDVTDPEPLPKDDPLWDAPNCIVTPHISGLGEAYADRSFQVLEVNLERRERGEKMINVVDRKKGY